MRGLAGCLWLLVVWAALVAGTAPGPAPAGRVGGGIPAPMPQPRCGAQGVLALPQPPDSLPPAGVDTAYVAGRHRLMGWQLGLGATGLAIGFQLIFQPITTGFLLLFLLAVLLCFAVAALLPGLLGQHRVRQIGLRWLATRGQRPNARPFPAPAPDTLPRQDVPTPRGINQRFWWFVGTAIFFTLMLVWPTGALLFFFDLVIDLALGWLVGLSLAVGFLGLVITTSIAFSWTRRLRRHAPNKPLQGVQLALYIAVFVALLALVVLVAASDFIFVVYLFPYMLLVIPFLLFLCAIITVARGSQIRNALGGR